MIISIKNTKLAIFSAALLTTLFNTGCTPDSKDFSLPATIPAVTFTATPLASNPNFIVVKNTTPGAFLLLWDYGNGSNSKKEADTVLYDAKGTYTLTLNAFNAGGKNSVSQTITIANDYYGVEKLQGGDMETASQSKWTLLNTGGTQTGIAFTNGVLKFTNSGDANGGIYQAVNVIAGKKYTFAADIAGGGATNTWFEIYFGKTVPVQGTDYSDNQYIAMNTWAGCGVSPFSGNLATIGCGGTGAGKNGVMTFTTSGTIYLVMKVGSCCGGNLGTGMTIDNISLKEK
jgi:PKD repeat protein